MTIYYNLLSRNSTLHTQTIHFPFLYMFFATAAFVRNETSERRSCKRAKKRHHTTIDKQIFTVPPTVKASFVENPAKQLQGIAGSFLHPILKVSKKHQYMTNALTGKGTLPANGLTNATNGFPVYTHNQTLIFFINRRNM